MSFLVLLILITLIALLSFSLTWIVRNISLEINIIDIPNERSSHTVPTPRSGGIAIVLSWYAGITFLHFSGLLGLNLYLALMCGIILAGVSFLDDIISLKPATRLLAQTISVILAFWSLGGINSLKLFDTDLLPVVILYPVSIVGIVWFINLYNFLDGIDGYASFEAICLATAFLLLTGCIINLILIASVLGFLVWNFPRAKIFMGDVGSTQLGFILVILGIYYHNEGNLSFLWWIILASPFWFDATLTLFRRWRNREELSQAHRKHVYQRLVQSGFSHLKVDMLLISINTVLIIFVLLFRNNDWLFLSAVLLSQVFLYSIVLFTDRRKPFQTMSGENDKT